ncbi:hypothetical protein [Halorubrum tibetense]|uniref:Cox cluster protein n=1 Tax=Halorubrum tibetense TaxID=175631 RepID=A0ABD5SI16_9EURY
MTDDGDDSDGKRSVIGESDDAREEAAPTPDPDAVGEVDFADLSLPQRVFVAAVQNPTRGVVIAALFAFAFSFYIAFWMVFPRLAAAFTGLGIVLAAVLAVVYYLFARYVD